MMTRRLLLSALLLVIVAAPLSAYAAPRPGDTPPGATVHVVQRGETLYSIAADYGVTVEAILALNDLDDPDYLRVGQRLIIPAPGTAPGTAESYAVQPGDTLDAIALYFGTTPAALVAANGLVNPGNIYAGQVLTLAGVSAPDRRVSGRTVIVQPGDTLTTIALRYHTTLRALLAANRLENGDYAYPGLRILVPQPAGESEPAAGPNTLPPPFERILLHPLPIRQGQTLVVRVNTSRPVTLTGSFGGRPLTFARDLQAPVGDGETLVAFGPVDALTTPGLARLALNAIDERGKVVEAGSNVWIAAGEFGQQYIDLSAEQCAATFDPAVTGPEYYVITTTTSLFTPHRYWDGLFQLPVGGDVSSDFGTRRRYSCAPDNLTYHEGLDLYRAPGTPVYAPAAGRVVLARELIVRGNAVIIDHGWGVFTGYWHLSKIGVQEGQIVAAGDYLGDVGSTGRATGPHLHWEMRVMGVPVEAAQWARELMP
jgi:murein DD-endopeptidase MepM/ murein hydrolase activator NlpD